MWKSSIFKGFVGVKILLVIWTSSKVSPFIGLLKLLVGPCVLAVLINWEVGF